MDPASIIAAYNGLKFAKDSFSALLDAKIDIEARSKITEALTKLGEAQDTLFQLREELFSLQADNAKLQRSIDQHNAWKERLAGYELAKTAGGAVVYRFKGEPEHYACPSCVNNQHLHILQDNRTNSGKFRCTGCDKEFPINPQKKPPPIDYGA